ncbi:MAG: hypothetical protein ACPGU7_01710 [Gammaproteobacteria bacterium]
MKSADTAAPDTRRGNATHPRSGVPLLALLVCVSLLVWLARDLPGPCHDTSRLAAADALVNHGSLSIDHSRFNYTCDRILVAGHYYSDKPPVLSLFYAAFLAVMQSVLGWNWSADLPAIHSLLVVATSGLSFLLVAAVFMRRALASQWPPVAAATLAIVLPAASQVGVFATALNAHIVAAALLLLFWDRVAPDTDRARGAMPGFGLGLILGLALVIDPLVVTFALAYLAWMAPDLWAARRSTLAALAGAALPVLVHGGLSWAIAGNPLAVNLNPEHFNYPGSQHDAHILTGVGVKHDSVGAFLNYGFDSLLGHHGFFVFNSVTLIGLLALRAGRPRATWIVLSTLGLFFALTIAFSNNQSGHAYGNRWHVLLVPLALYALFNVPWARIRALRPAVRIGMWLVVLWGLVIAVIGLRNPWTPAIEARPSFLVQLSRDPRYVAHELERAVQFLRAGYFHEARGYAELALNHGPTNPQAWWVAVRAAEELGDGHLLRGYRDALRAADVPEPLKTQLLGRINTALSDP